MARLDIALCPMRSGWSSVHADSKPLEHLAAGALPLISDVPTFDYWKPLLPPACATKADWLERVEWAVGNQDEVRRQAMELRDRVLEERSIHLEIASWRAALAA